MVIEISKYIELIKMSYFDMLEIMTLPDGSVIKNGVGYKLIGENGFMPVTCSFAGCASEQFKYIYMTYRKNKYGVWCKGLKVGRDAKVEKIL